MSSAEGGGGMVAADARWREARRLLVEGRAVEVGGYTVRFFPSYREISRGLRCHVSTVARWVKREGVLDARRERLAADRVATTTVVPMTTETLAEETLALINADLATRRKAASMKTTTTVLRLLASVYGVAEARPGLARELEWVRGHLMNGRAS